MAFKYEIIGSAVCQALQFVREHKWETDFAKRQAGKAVEKLDDALEAIIGLQYGDEIAAKMMAIFDDSNSGSYTEDMREAIRGYFEFNDVPKTEEGK